MGGGLRGGGEGAWSEADNVAVLPGEGGDRGGGVGLGAPAAPAPGAEAQAVAPAAFLGDPLTPQRPFIFGKNLRPGRSRFRREPCRSAFPAGASPYTRPNGGSRGVGNHPRTSG